MVAGWVRDDLFSLFRFTWKWNVVCFYSSLLSLLCWVLKPCVKFSSSLFFCRRCRRFPLFVYWEVCFFVSFKFSLPLSVGTSGYCPLSFFLPFFISRIHLKTTKNIFFHQTWAPILIYRLFNIANQIYIFSAKSKVCFIGALKPVKTAAPVFYVSLLMIIFTFETLSFLFIHVCSELKKKKNNLSSLSFNPLTPLEKLYFLRTQ